MNPLWRVKAHLMLRNMWSPEVETAEALYLLYEADKRDAMISACTQDQ